MGDLGSVPGLERSPEKGKATHSSVSAWRILRREGPGGLQTTESQSRTWLSTALLRGVLILADFSVFSDYLHLLCHLIFKTMAFQNKTLTLPLDF